MISENKIKDAINKRVIDSILDIIESTGISKSNLAETFGISNSKFSEILKNRMRAGSDIMYYLVNDFYINAEWLLIGKGAMCRKNTRADKDESNEDEGIEGYLKELDRRIEILEQRNKK